MSAAGSTQVQCPECGAPITVDVRLVMSTDLEMVIDDMDVADLVAHLRLHDQTERSFRTSKSDIKVNRA